MALRSSMIPAALALAGCLPGESEPPPDVGQVTYSTPETGGVCAVEHVVHHVYGQVLRGGARDKAAVSSGGLLVTVSESSSVVECGEDLVKIATPGAELATAAFDPASDFFDVEIPAVLVGGHRPSIRVEALLDVNDNGRCDEGEQVGAVELEDSELGELAIELASGCPVRQ